MDKITTSISKTVKGTNGEANKREKIGDVTYLQPTLADFGIAGYGQVCRPVPQKLGGGNNCITSRVRADVEEGW